MEGLRRYGSLSHPKALPCDREGFAFTRDGEGLRESPQTAYDLQKKARERPEMSNKVYHSGVGSGCRTLALGLRSRIDIKPAIHMKLRHSFRPVKSQRVGPIHPYLLYGLS